jgi:hypothetical protein
VRDQVRDRLDYTFEDLGEQQVKNGVLGHLAPVKAGHHLAPVEPIQIQTDRGYTMFASRSPLTLKQTVLTTRFSQIRGPYAPMA